MEKQMIPQDNELLTEIAVSYYQDEMTQEEIAHKFGISRIKVGRLLKRAKTEGIVEINVRYHPVFSTRLEQQLIEHFGLKRALIALDYQDEDEQRRQVAALVSAYLATNLKDNTVLAVGQGVMLRLSQTTSASCQKGTVSLSVASVEHTAQVMRLMPITSVAA